jgi:hypothetical protein
LISGIGNGGGFANTTSGWANCRFDGKAALVEKKNDRGAAAACRRPAATNAGAAIEDDDDDDDDDAAVTAGVKQHRCIKLRSSILLLVVGPRPVITLSPSLA